MRPSRPDFKCGTAGGVPALTAGAVGALRHGPSCFARDVMLGIPNSSLFPSFTGQDDPWPSEISKPTPPDPRPDALDDLRQCLAPQSRREDFELLGRRDLLQFAGELVRGATSNAPPRPVDHQLIERLQSLLQRVVEDDQAAIRCRLLWKNGAAFSKIVPDKQADRLGLLANMEAVCTELARVPLRPLESPLLRRCDGLRQDGPYRDVQRWYETCDNAAHQASVTVPVDQAAQLIEWLRQLLPPLMTPAMQEFNDEAQRLLRPRAGDNGTVSLSQQGAAVVSQALQQLLHLDVALRGCRADAPVFWVSPVELALQRLCEWAKRPAGQLEALGRERWYTYLLKQVHWPSEVWVQEGAWADDGLGPDRGLPPAELMTNLQAALGRPLIVTLRYRGEPVVKPADLRAVLQARCCPGLAIDVRELGSDSLTSLPWSVLTHLLLVDGEGTGASLDLTPVVAALARDAPALSMIQLSPSLKVSAAPPGWHFERPGTVLRRDAVTGPADVGPRRDVHELEPCGASAAGPNFEARTGHAARRRRSGPGGRLTSGRRDGRIGSAHSTRTISARQFPT